MKKAAKKQGRPSKGGRDPLRQFRAPDDQFNRWEQAAELDELNMSEFIRKAADRLANMILKRHGKAT